MEVGGSENVGDGGDIRGWVEGSSEGRERNPKNQLNRSHCRRLTGRKSKNARERVGLSGGLKGLANWVNSIEINDTGTDQCDWPL